jgi:tripartite ATP-independent transporter DctP family solute receptor
MLKKFRCLALVMALILVVVSGTTFAAVKPIKLVFGNVFPADHFFVKGDLYFKELVEKNSKGKILVDYFPACQLGSSSEMFQATRTGAQQMFVNSPGSLSPYWSKLGTFDLPYLYRDQEHLLKVASKFNSLINQNEMGSKTGMRVISVRIQSPRHLTPRFPVNKLEDIKGLKIRVGENAIQKALWKSLGAVPTTIPPADVYTALATGTVDAQENPFATIYANKYYEQIKYCAETAHIQEVSLMLINNKFWNSLTATQKKILSNAADKSSQMMIKAVIDNEDEYKKLLEKQGMKFTKPDLAPFREKAKTIWSRFGDQELLKKIEAIK